MTPQRPSTIPAPSPAKAAHYPRWMYHPDLPDRVVKTKEEETLLKASGWGRTPHPPKAAPAEVDSQAEMLARVEGVEKAIAAISEDFSKLADLWSRSLSEAIGEIGKQQIVVSGNFADWQAGVDKSTAKAAKDIQAIKADVGALKKSLGEAESTDAK